MTSLIVITHGGLGQALLGTAEMIIGPQPGVTVIPLEVQDSLASLSGKLGAVLQQVPPGEGTLLLTDMLGGTPCNAALTFVANHPVEIVTGVNLYMLLSACTNRATMSLPELAEKAMTDGKKNIANAKEIFLKRIT